MLYLVGYQTKACADSFGGTNFWALEEEVSKKVDKYESMLQQSAEKCNNEAVIATNLEQTPLLICCKVIYFQSLPFAEFLP